MNERITKQRLFDYFVGKATELEKQQIEEWSRHPAHEELFYDWLDEWEKTHLQYTPNQSNAVEDYHDFLYADQTPTAGTPKGRYHTMPGLVNSQTQLTGWLKRRSWMVWTVAASVVVMLGWFGFHERLLTRSYTTGYGETRRLTLPDGSEVTLNANSSLRIPRFGFGTHTREVRLTGEALFSVTHTATNQRFVVKTDNGLSQPGNATPGPEVVVLGTEFTVFTRQRGTRVELNRGKVEVHYQQSDQRIRQVTMKPGDLVSLSPKGEVVRRLTKRVAAVPAWADHRFVFDQTPLTEIVAMLGENYGLTVEIADAEMGRLTLSGAYPAQNGDELLRIVAEVLDIKISRHTDKTILSFRRSDPNPVP